MTEAKTSDGCYYLPMMQPKNWIKTCDRRIAHMSCSTNIAVHRIMNVLQTTPACPRLALVRPSVVRHWSKLCICLKNPQSSLGQILAFGTQSGRQVFVVEKPFKVGNNSCVSGSSIFAGTTKSCVDLFELLEG
jgi:hypothetical protein